MTLLFKILAIGIIYVILASALKEIRADYVVLIRFAAIIIVVTILIDEIVVYIENMFSIFDLFNIESMHINTLLKIAGITIISDMIYDSLSDSGETTIARLISTTSKIIIIGMSMPILNSLIVLCTEIIK